MDHPRPHPHLPIRAELLPQRVPQVSGQEISQVSTRSNQSWADIRAFVRISHSNEETWSTVELSRPYVMIGRKAGCDISISHTDLESVHTYLHFDSHGCHAIDLRTRTGMRINGRAVTSGRFRPGDTLEIGGIRIRLDGVLIHGNPLSEDCSGSSPISIKRNSNLIGLQLLSMSDDRRHWVIQSPIAFLGSEPGCAVPMPGHSSASRLHGVIVRTDQSAFYVDLASRGSHINGIHIFNDCCELYHNDILSVGQCGFLIQRNDSVLNDGKPDFRHKKIQTNSLSHIPQSPDDPHLDLSRLLLNIQDRHDQAMEHQMESQVALTQLLRQVQSEQSKIMESHLQRIQTMDLEITRLKAQMNHRSPPSITSEDPINKSLEDSRLRIGTTVVGTSEPSNFEIIGTSKADDLEQTMHDPCTVDSTAWLIDRVARPDPDQTGPLKELIRRLRGR